MSTGAKWVDVEIRPHMAVNTAFIPILESAGLASFEGAYCFEGGTVVKRIKARSVTRIEVQHGSTPCILYLKRHFANHPTLGERVAAWTYGRSISPGMGEFENICEFRRHGLATATPVAAGQRKTATGKYESFLITESVDPFVSIEAIIRHRPEYFQGDAGTDRKKRILAAVADLARTMHAKGLNHRDFNATHVLVGTESPAGRASLALFDLQRVDRKKWLRTKWTIKTIAELVYSLPSPLFTATDHRLLFENYRCRPLRGAWDRFCWWWISRKVDRIAKHTEKIEMRREKMKPEEKEIRPY